MKVDVEIIKEIVDHVEEIAEICQALKAFVPVTAEVVDVVLAHGPALAKLEDSLSDYSVNRKIKNYKMYIDGGLPPDAALALTLSGDGSIESILKNIPRDK